MTAPETAGMAEDSGVRRPRLGATAFLLDERDQLSELVDP
jgi:hypothetical protein